MITTSLRKFKTYYYTVKHLSIRQICYRLRLMVLKVVERRFGMKVLAFYRKRLQANRATYSPTLSHQHEPDFGVHLRQSWDSIIRMQRAEEIARHRFTFLNETRTLSGGDLWRAEGASQLWRYNIHYFDYTLDLALACQITGDQAFYGTFKDLVCSWLKSNPPGTPDAWHPYVVSLRVVNWMYGSSFFRTFLAEDQEFRSTLEESIALQLDYLSHHMEHDVRGNHLLKNAKALLAGGIFFCGARAAKWKRVGLELLELESREQVLPDGGHFERSLMYHLIVLQDYAESSLLLREAGQPNSDIIIATVDRMVTFLRGMLCPDGDIPLFGDAELVGPHRVQEVLNFARVAVQGWYTADVPSSANVLMAGVPSRGPVTLSQEPQGLHSFEITGYHAFRKEGACLIVDCGDPCPPYLPAHAHCDLQSYELSLESKRFIVDAGTYEYRAGDWRQFFRSTKAHNTLIVNGTEQSNAWGSFRLAERARVLKSCVTREQGGVESFIGVYDTPHLGSLRYVHQRSILWIDRSYWIVVDLVKGKGPLRGANQILFHPDCSLEVGNSLISGEREGILLHVVPSGGQPITVEDAWYAPYFGVKYKAKRVVLQSLGEKEQLVTAYALVPGSIGRHSVGLTVQGNTVCFIDSTGERAWRIPTFS